MTRTLPRVPASPPGKPAPPPETTALLRAFARDLLPAGHHWTTEAARFFTDLFDQLAATWDTGQATGRDEPLRDALTRGRPLPTGPCLEIGSGTGTHTNLLTTTFPAVISLDLSEQLLRARHCRLDPHHPRPGTTVRSNSALRTPMAPTGSSTPAGRVQGRAPLRLSLGCRHQPSATTC